MKKILFLSLLLSYQLAYSDDTEIYGASAIDAENRVNSNVLFIMDTSGSMEYSVTEASAPFITTTVYSGNYDVDKFYNNLKDSPEDGHNLSTLSGDNSSGCASTITSLQNEGRIYGRYAQRGFYNNWRNLWDGSQRDIRCNQSYWDKAYTLYSGNYMNYYYSTTFTTRTRLQTVVDVVNDLTESLTNINLGLMRFDSEANGGMVDIPVSDIISSGPAIRSKMTEYLPLGYTPLSETLYEGMLYMRGDKWDYGANSNPNKSVPESLIADTSTYKTPIEQACQKNHIILLTDGAPTEDTGANSKIHALIQGMTLPSGLSANCSYDGGCLDELAYWGRNTDHSDTIAGNQEITTYTIGGFDDSVAGGANTEDSEAVKLLKRTASWGGGKYFGVKNTKGLVEALDSIFLDILSTDSTFTAPAVSVNAFNASEHRDELFYALFRPDDKIKWAGNLKRYKLTDEGIVIGAKSDAPAISQATGFFNEGVFDFWNTSDEPDGKNVDKGGAANQFPSIPANRKVYTNNDSNNVVLLKDGASRDSFEMDEETYTDAEYSKVLNWSLGQDVLNYDGDDDETETRQQMGDPLHSEPVVITYGGTEEKPDSTIYFGTNEGFIHAIDTITGQEQFAFIPKELHVNQKEYFYNNAAAGDKPYGMDGLITSWFYDKNRNNIILDPNTNQVEDGEHVYLYAGMRRGGRNYYALDVTNRSTPKLLFKIEGGTPGFERLGQTWSKMIIGRVKIAGNIKEVLFFSGGYDENQDSNTKRENDTIGNAIYMVDAADGTLLGWAGSPDDDKAPPLKIEGMNNSIPASPSVIDINGDGLVDYLFAVDTGGRVFRIDFPGGSIDEAVGGMIADLNDGTETGNRRFYNKPNVALVKDRQRGDYLTIAVGSGHRAHPILTTEVENRFYVIKDFNPYSVPKSYSVTTEAPTSKTTLGEGELADPNKLYNATSLMTEGKSALTSSMQRLMANGGGFYVTFSDKGEKVLAESTTFSGAIIFTSFSPTGTSANACGGDTGLSRTYVIDQQNAMSVIDLDGDGDVDENDSSKDLAHSGIAPRPVVIYRSNGGKTIAIGTETIDDSRFGEGEEYEEGCEETNSCPTNDDKKCNGANCNVTPKYWRQNDL